MRMGSLGSQEAFSILLKWTQDVTYALLLLVTVD